jgi:hypothetical protein
MQFCRQRQKVSFGTFSPLPDVAGRERSSMSKSLSVNSTPQHVSGERLTPIWKDKGGSMEEPNRNKPFWRQGDIYFVKLDEEIDSGNAAPVKSGIIAKGETTGHAHRVSPSSIAEGALLCLVGRSMFLRSLEAGATIVHDEHGPIELPRGSYAVVAQQEFDGLRWRQVLD